MRKKVFGFYITLAISIGLLLILQNSLFGSPTGFLILDKDVPLNERNAFFPVLSGVDINDKIKVNYIVYDYSGESRYINVNYRLKDFQDYTISESNEKIFLEGNKAGKYFSIIALPKNAFGEFLIEFSFNDGVVTKESSWPIVISNKKGITSNVILDSDSNKLSVFGVVFVILLFFAILAFYFIKVKKNRYLQHSFNRQLKRRIIHIKN